MSPPAPRRQAAVDACALAILALAFRLFYIAYAQPEILLRADASQYFRIAMNVVEHGVFSTADPRSATPAPDGYRGPGYPSLLAAPLALLRDVEGAYWCMLVFQAVLGAAVASLAYLLGRQWLPRMPALICASLVALSPHLVTQGACILTEPVFGFLLVAGVYAKSRAIASKRPGAFILAGALFAAAALVNSMIVAFSFMVAVGLFLRRDRRLAAIFLVAALLPPTLWAIRDHSLPDTGSHSAGSRLFENVLIGIEPDYNRWYRDPTDARGLAAHERVHDGLVQYQHDKADAYASVARRVLQQPSASMSWFLQKPLLLWSWNVGQGAGDIYVYPMVSSPFETNVLYRLDVSVFVGLNGLIMLGAFATLAMLLARMFSTRFREQPVAYLLCAAVFSYATLLYWLLAPDARYANPFRPFEFLLATSCATFAVERWRARRTSAGSQESAPGG